ncbi:hypothetical protein NOCA2130002 [metagenome]|uniref:CBU-0592-like domain-containing protein n=1 Tax=metagenome TaxID=256318 RepID=A0A2P2C0D5_9ZZZZ
MLSPMDLLGWTGGMMGAVAYVLVSNRRIRPDSVAFQGVNMVGAAMLATASFSAGAIPSAGMNALWIAFGLHALVVGGRSTARSSSDTGVQPVSAPHPHAPADDRHRADGVRRLCGYRRTSAAGDCTATRTPTRARHESPARQSSDHRQAPVSSSTALST